MDLRIASIRRFLYSHYFFGGVRQGVGMLLPVLVLGGLFGNYTTGLVATFGAQCLAIIDQPGGPQRHRTNEMLGGAALGTLTVIITGLASSHPVLIWLAVIAQCFVYSMFTVFGKRGGLIGFAGLLLMTLTTHSAWGSRACSGCARSSRPCRWRSSPPPTTWRRAPPSTMKPPIWTTPTAS
jgi:uncharacterized membrane protein YccC